MGVTGLPAAPKLPPTTIDAGPVELRHIDADESAALVEAINDSLDHLRPWMEWAQSPATLSGTALYLALQHERFLAADSFSWCIFDGDRLVGGCGLHRRDPDPAVLEVGYWLRPDVQGRGFATAAAGALVRVAFEELGVEVMRLRCAATNGRSQAVARRLGFDHVDTIAGSMTWERHRPKEGK